MKTPFWIKAVVTAPVWVPLFLFSIYIGIFGALLGYGFCATVEAVLEAVTLALKKQADAQEGGL